MSSLPPESTLMETSDTADDNATARDVRDDADGAGAGAGDVDEHDVTRCISVAEKALANGDLKKAKIFLLKAEEVFLRRTHNARQLLKQLEEAKKADETPEPTPPEATTNVDTNNATHIDIDSVHITDDTNYDNRNKCMDIAKQAFVDKNFEKAQRFLKKAQRFDPLLDIKDMLNIVEDEIKRKAGIDNLIKLTNDAIAAENYEKALDYINEVKSIDHKVDVRNLKSTAFMGFKQQKAAIMTQKAKSCIKNKNFEGAEEFLRQVQYIDPERDISDLWKTVEQALIRQRTINNFKKVAESALKSRDFAKAEASLDRIKRVDPETDVQDLEARIRAGVASANSTDTSINFIPTDCKKKNSKKCVQIARDALKQKDIKVAEEFLHRAKSYYNSMELESLFKELENLKKCNTTADIPAPSYEHSNSGTRFVYKPENVETPSYHLPQTMPEDNYEKCLKNAQFALVNGNIEKAEYFAGECDTLWPNTTRVKGLRDDINKLKAKINYGAFKTRSGLVYKNPDVQTHCDSKAQAERLFAQALDAMHNNAYYLSEMLLSKANSIFKLEAANDLLATVRNEIKERVKSDSRSKLDESKEKEAEILYKMAQNKFQNRDLDYAQSLALISLAFSPKTWHTKKLLQSIVEAKYVALNSQSQVNRESGSNYYNNKKKIPEHVAMCKANCLLEMAKTFRDAQNYQLAKEYSEKSDELYPSFEAKKLRAEVRSLEGNSTSSVWNSIYSHFDHLF